MVYGRAAVGVCSVVYGGVAVGVRSGLYGVYGRFRRL